MFDLKEMIAVYLIIIGIVFGICFGIIVDKQKCLRMAELGYEQGMLAGNGYPVWIKK